MKLQKIKDKIIEVQGQQVILDNDVAELYGVETKHINQAVRNNPEKFPPGYILVLDDEEWDILRSKNLTAKYSKTRVPPKAFTERALYMLATIVRSPIATHTTLAIVETFTKLREFTRTLAEIQKQPEEASQKNLLQRSGAIISDLLDDDWETTDTETTIKLNLALLSVEHTIKKKKKGKTN